MLTIRHFEAIGKLVYQSSIMESRLCHLMLVLKHQGSETWASEVKKFRFSEEFKKELRELVLKAHLNGKEKFLACLSEAEDLHSRRNDIIHGLWQLPAEGLFGTAWQDILGAAPAALALRVPARKDAESYFVSYTAEQIEEVAERIQSVTVELVAFPSFGSDA